MSLSRFVRLLIRLKWVLTLRHFQRNKAGAAMTGIALGTLLLVLISGLALIAAYLHYGGENHRFAFLMWGLWIASFLWISAPLSQFDAQRNLDLTALRLLPLPRTWFTLAVLLDGVVSPLGIISVPVGIGMCAAFTLHWAELPLIALALLILFAFQLGCAQTLFLLGNRIFTSRRYSDISMGCGFVLFFGIQMLNVAIQTHGLHLPPWAAATVAVGRQLLLPLAQWLAPGVGARAIEAGIDHDVPLAVGLYALLAAQAGIAILLAGWAARVFYESELESGGAAPATRPLAKGRHPGGAGGLAGLAQRLGAGPALSAILQREQVYLWRDPAVRIQLLQSLFATLYLAFAAVMLNLKHGDAFSYLRQESLGKYALLGIAVMLGLSESSVLFNKFGYEGGQLASALLTPVSRRTLLAGKSLFLVSHFVVLNLVLCVGFGLALHAPPLFILLALLLVLTNTMLLDVIGHFVSIFYPFAYRKIGRRMRPIMPQPGCGYMLVYILVFNLSNLAAFPVSVCSALLVIFFGWPGLPLALLLSGGVCWAAYHFGLPQAAMQLEQREPLLLAALAKGTEN